MMGTTKYNLTPEQVEELKTLTPTQIMEKYGVNYRGSLYIRKKYGIVRNKSRTPLTQEKIADLGRLSTKEYCKKYGIVANTVYMHRKKYGVTDFPRERQKKIPIPPRSDLIGRTARDIIRTYGVSRKRAHSWLTYRGLTPIKDRKKEELEEENKKLRKQVSMLDRNIRLASIFPFLRDVNIARIFNITRERVRQLRMEMGVKYIIDTTSDIEEMEDEK